MCRWIYYYGEEVCISKLIYGASHGLATMADRAGWTPGCARDAERNHEVNVHGCGIGWYASKRCGMVDKHGLNAYCRPGVYTTVCAPSHDRNLRSLSKSLNASLLFGHVRAAGPGASVHQYNCHPFVRGRYMFMHNGDVADFKAIRRGLLSHLSDELFDQMSGTTDSELLFSLILNELPNVYEQMEPKTLEKAVFKAICLIIKANRGKANSINVALTDGETIIATRYRNSATEEPPSLYFHLGPMPGEKAWDLDSAEGLAGFDRLVDHNIHANTGGPRQRRNPSFQAILKKKIFATQSLLVSSEPLSMNGLANWQLCPPNCMIIAHPTQPTKGRCSREFLLQQLNEGRAASMTSEGDLPASPTKASRQMTSSDSPVLEIEFKCLEDLCDTILSFKPKLENSASTSNITGLSSPSKPEIRRKNSLPDQTIEAASSNFLSPADSPPPSMAHSPTAARAIRPGGMLGISGLSQQLARSSLRSPAADFVADVDVRPNSTSRLSIDHQGTSPNDRKHALRRELSITNMAGTSWHEGSQYLR